MHFGFGTASDIHLGKLKQRAEAPGPAAKGPVAKAPIRVPRGADWITDGTADGCDSEVKSRR